MEHDFDLCSCVAYQRKINLKLYHYFSVQVVFAGDMKQKGRITMFDFDPDLKRSSRMKAFEEDRQRLEKQGIYKAPNFMLIGGFSFFLIVLIIVIILIVLHP